MMKMVMAVIKPFKLDDVREALAGLYAKVVASFSVQWRGPS